jgi:hypothetical protein
MFFRFPPDARWNPERSVVEFGVGVGDYEGVVRVSRRMFQSLLDQSPTPERCLEAYHLHRTRLELIAQRKLRRRQLTDDGNVEITGRDLREREVRAHLRRPIGLTGPLHESHAAWRFAPVMPPSAASEQVRDAYFVIHL